MMGRSGGHRVPNRLVLRPSIACPNSRTRMRPGPSGKLALLPWEFWGQKARGWAALERIAALLVKSNIQTKWCDC